MKSIQNVILDLDETLISSNEILDFDWDKYDNKIPKFISNKIYDYLTFERPYMQDFLDYAFANYNVSVWTAGTPSYAFKIVDQFITNKPGRDLDYIFFSDHCDLAESIYGGHKDLRLLWDVFKLEGYDSDNTVILDDQVTVFDTQPINTIAVPPFNFTDDGSENDDFFKIAK